jgi:hypothetical protein
MGGKATRDRHGIDYYIRIGQKGGTAPHKRRGPQGRATEK